jgi:hypothetical protein
MNNKNEPCVRNHNAAARQKVVAIGIVSRKLVRETERHHRLPSGIINFAFKWPKEVTHLRSSMTIALM